MIFSAKYSERRLAFLAFFSCSLPKQTWLILGGMQRQSTRPRDRQAARRNSNVDARVASDERFFRNLAIYWLCHISATTQENAIVVFPTRFNSHAVGNNVPFRDTSNSPVWNLELVTEIEWQVPHHSCRL